MRCPKCSGPATPEDTHCPNCAADLRETAELPYRPGDKPTPAAVLKFPPGARFAGRYTIVEKAGEGGMGVVYKAIDNALGLTVALKLIQPRLASVPAFEERFKREVRLTRQITHPNVGRVHDIGESQGILYISMEWIKGETLRQLLKQAGMLREDRALGIALKIAEALEAAHGREIIHRDLKPENVMIDDRGEIYVMDFGLAEDRGAGDSSAAGIPAGTPGYMAPEQRRGEKLDARVDLYALGLILREMLSGRPPHPERPLRADLGLGARRQILPVLERLLAENRDERYASAGVLVEALRHLRAASVASPTSARIQRAMLPGLPVLFWGGVAILLFAATLTYLWLLPHGQAPARPVQEDAAPSLVYYQRALHYLREEAETDRGLDDAIQMMHRAVTIDPAFALGWAGLGDGYWTRHERTGDPSSRDEAVFSVEKALQLDPALPEAHNARGLGLITQGRFAEARTELTGVVRSRPEFDAAWLNLGRACQQLGDYAAGLKAIQTAIRLQPDSFRYQIYLGLFYDHFAEYEAAAGAYHRAIDLKPGSTMAWNNLGAFFLRTGRPEEAVPAFLRSIGIEERATARANLGTAYYSLGKYEQAAESYTRATALEPKQASYWGDLGDALKMLRSEKAREAYLQAVRLARDRVATSPQDPEARERLGLYCAKAGEEGCALSEGNRAAAMQPENAEIVFSNAVIRCLLGRQEEALDWLEKSVKLGLTRAQVEIEPDLAPLHTHPRYRRILELAS